MYKDKSEKYHTILKRARHYLFLNPYGDMAFTRCPKCEEKTKFCEQNAPEIEGNDYFVLGTMDRKDWKKGQTEEMSQQEAIKHLTILSCS